MWHLKKYIKNPNFLQNVNMWREVIYSLKNTFCRRDFFFLASYPTLLNFDHLLESVDLAPVFSGSISRMRFSWVRVTILYLSIILTCMAYMAFDNLTDPGGFCPNGVDRGKSKPLLRQGRKIQISHCVLQKCRWKKKVSENRLHFSPFDNSILAAA